MTVTLERFCNHASHLNGRVLRTLAQGREFRIDVIRGRVFYTPVASGKSRRHTPKAMEAVLQRYDERRSMHPKDYLDVTANASYTLAVLRDLLDHNAR